jgi:hypothetical protein
MTRKSNLFFTGILIFFMFPSSLVFAQVSSGKTEKVSVVFGLNQPIVVRGFNFEVNYWMKKFVIDYSHGFGLKFKGNLVSDEAKKQQLNFNVTNSLGIGFGYRFTKNFNIRIEPKLHIWEMYYNDQFGLNKITTYTTYTLGLGTYYKWQPFEKKLNLLNGLTIVPSIRWWPNIASTLSNNKFIYQNQKTGKTETINANNIGIANTPFFANVSIGYTFSK